MIAYIKEKKITGLNYISNDGGGSGDCDLDFTQIGYEGTPQSMIDAIEYAKEIQANWDAENVTRTEYFRGDNNLVFFPAVDLSKVKYASLLFCGCQRLSIIPANLNMQNLKNGTRLCSGCTCLQHIDCSNWNISENLTHIDGIFGGCSSLESANLTNWNTSNVNNMADLFHGCEKLKTVNLNNWDTSKVTDIARSFSACSSVEILDLSSWNLSNVKTINSMFEMCVNLKTLNIQNFQLSAVTNINKMFRMCSGLTSLDLSSWNTSNVTAMEGVFGYCSGLTSLDLSSWNTSNVTTMYQMFQGCNKLTFLDLSSFNTSNVTSMNYMFDGCARLERIDGHLDWSKIKSYPSSFIVSSSPYPLRHMTIKNIGKTGTTFNLSNTFLQNWGDETDTTTYPLSVGARTSLVDSLVTYTHDRATAGMSTCTITLHANAKARLTADEIAQITAKGYTIA